MKTPLSRRDFLKTSAIATGAGLTTPFWQSYARAAAPTPAASLNICAMFFFGPMATEFHRG